MTKTSGLGGRSAFSTSAMWVDVDRDGLLDLFVCNYVRWSTDRDVFCSLDGKQKSSARPRRIAATPRGCSAIAATGRSRT